MTPEEKKDWMRQRIQQLRNQLDEISGGEMRLQTPRDEDETVPLEAELAFLEQVVRYETAPESTWRKKLKETGYEMPPSEALTDEQVAFEVWQVIQRLSELHVYMHWTNHLSDRELYERLNEHRDEPRMDCVMGAGATYHFEMLVGGSEEDDQAYLRYYADDATRKQWQEDFNVELPPREDPPYDRDQYLPEQVIPEPLELQFARMLVETAWDSELSPMKLSAEFTAGDLEKVVAFQLARTLLEIVGARGKVKATAKRGMLPRSVVREVFEKQPFPLERVQRHHEVFKTFDEIDFSKIFFVREACRTAGLLRKYNGAFQLTKKGARLLGASHSGELYLELFRAGVTKVNLAAFDGIDGYASLQETLPVILFRLWEEGEEWGKMEEAAESYLLPEPYDELLEKEENESWVASTLWIRIFRWLDDFGLLETRPDPKALPLSDIPLAIRISKIGQRLLDFDVPEYPDPF